MTFFILTLLAILSHLAPAPLPEYRDTSPAPVTTTTTTAPDYPSDFGPTILEPTTETIPS